MPNKENNIPSTTTITNPAPVASFFRRMMECNANNTASEEVEVSFDGNSARIYQIGGGAAPSRSRHHSELLRLAETHDHIHVDDMTDDEISQTWYTKEDIHKFKMEQQQLANSNNKKETRRLRKQRIQQARQQEREDVISEGEDSMSTGASTTTSTDSSKRENEAPNPATSSRCHPEETIVFSKLSNRSDEEEEPTMSTQSSSFIGPQFRALKTVQRDTMEQNRVDEMHSKLYQAGLIFRGDPNRAEIFRTTVLKKRSRCGDFEEEKKEDEVLPRDEMVQPKTVDGKEMQVGTIDTAFSLLEKFSLDGSDKLEDIDGGQSWEKPEEKDYLFPHSPFSDPAKESKHNEIVHDQPARPVNDEEEDAVAVARLAELESEDTAPSDELALKEKKQLAQMENEEVQAGEEPVGPEDEGVWTEDEIIAPKDEIMAQREEILAPREATLLHETTLRRPSFEPEDGIVIENGPPKPKPSTVMNVTPVVKATPAAFSKGRTQELYHKDLFDSAAAATRPRAQAVKVATVSEKPSAPMKRSSTSTRTPASFSFPTYPAPYNQASESMDYFEVRMEEVFEDKKRSPELVNLAREYQDFRRKLRSLTKSVKKYHESMKQMEQARSHCLQECSTLFQEPSAKDQSGSFQQQQQHAVVGKSPLIKLKNLAESQQAIRANEFKERVLDYALKWEDAVTKKVDFELKEVKKFQQNRLHYEKKVEQLRKKIIGLDNKGKEVSADLVEKMERNESKLTDAWETHELRASRLCSLIEQVTQAGWKDLYPLVANLMKFEFNRSGGELAMYGKFPLLLDSFENCFRGLEETRKRNQSL